MTQEQYHVPLRGLNEFAYCPRLFHLMYVQGLFEESVDTLEGRLAHQKRLAKGKAAARTALGDEAPIPWPADLVKEFSLSSDTLGISGKFDILLASQGETIPVEVKHGPAPTGGEGFCLGPFRLSAKAWGNDQVQLAAQMALLREAGHTCSMGRLYYRETSTLVEIPWDEQLAGSLRWVVGQARQMPSLPMPEPLPDSNKCIRCSMNYVCLPDETMFLKGKNTEPRQLYPGRDDTGILHLVTPGAQLGKTGEALKISVPGEKDVLTPIKDVGHVCCWGNAQISTQAMLALADQGTTIAWLSQGGWLRAVTTPPLSKNVHLRRTQYKVCDDGQKRLLLSRWLVAAKIENQRVLLRRNGKEGQTTGTLQSLKNCRIKAEKAADLDELRGLEGAAARAYWETFPLLLRTKGIAGMDMDGRNRRPPKDPVNALLSFGYVMLMRDFMAAIQGAGMDPLYGFFHGIVPGRPALALDLMEAFRPLVVDSAVLRAVNEGSFLPEDFVQTTGYCAMKPHAKKRWITAYERRVDEMVTHPVFGYRLSYRRIFTLESRLFGRFLAGEITEYRPLQTR